MISAHPDVVDPPPRFPGVEKVGAGRPSRARVDTRTRTTRRARPRSQAWATVPCCAVRRASTGASAPAHRGRVDLVFFPVSRMRGQLLRRRLRVARRMRSAVGVQRRGSPPRHVVASTPVSGRPRTGSRRPGRPLCGSCTRTPASSRVGMLDDRPQRRRRPPSPSPTAPLGRYAVRSYPDDTEASVLPHVAGVVSWLDQPVTSAAVAACSLAQR